MPITVKNSVQFPEIGQIRKGGVMTKTQDPSQTRPGKDLNEKFRVLFFPGNEASAEKFISAHPKEGLFPTRILAMLPFQRLDDCWVVYNEAYSAGRMLARADGEKYITLRDGRTGEYIVSNGEPYKPFTVGDMVSYTDPHGKRQNIKIKPVGKLYLFLPGLDRAVYMTLKTTSFYDALNIQGQLNAIEHIAAGFGAGSVQGITIWIYRRPQMITWNKPDGSAVRVEKWLINVEIDVEWMKRAAERMSRFALGEGTDAPALPASISGTFDPDEDEDHDEATEGAFVEAQVEPETTIVSPRPAPNGHGHEPEPDAAPLTGHYVVPKGENAPNALVSSGICDSVPAASALLSKHVPQTIRADAQKVVDWGYRYRGYRDADNSVEEAAKLASA